MSILTDHRFQQLLDLHVSKRQEDKDKLVDLAETLEYCYGQEYWRELFKSLRAMGV